MKRCKRCLYDETVSKIVFDSRGVCNYCHLHDQLDREYPMGSEGERKLHQITNKVKRTGCDKKYDVAVGISGGCDSSYLLYITKQLGLRPLAVHFDNGWNTDTAVTNMANVTKSLGVDMYTVKVDSKEYDDICRSFLKSGVSDIDIANDIGLATALYIGAEKYNIKYIFIGHSFRTEGIAPLGWTYMDGKYIESIQNQYGTCALKTLPNLWLSDFLRWSAIKGIKRIRPLYYVDYVKEDVKKFLSSNFGWKWYGGHHFEKQFTNFHLYFMWKRYGVDMRLLEHSALVRSEQMSRKRGLELIKQPPKYNLKLIGEVRKRLGLSQKELDDIIKQPRKTYRDFKTYKQVFEDTRWFWWLMYKLNRIPKSFYIKYTK